MSNLAVVVINDQACYIRSTKFHRNLALIAYSPDNKQWVAEILWPCMSDKTLMIIAKFVYKKNKESNPEYSLAT